MTKFPKLSGETKLSLILLTIQPIRNLKININLLLTPDAQHRIVFPEGLIVGFKRGQVLKICWLGQKFQWKKKQMGNLVVARENTAKFALFLAEKSTFTNKERSDTYNIREGLHLSCNSENVVYLITCKKLKKQYEGSCITKFRTRFNKYRSCHKKSCRDHSVIQALFHAHFMLDEHCGINEWKLF